MYDSVCVGLIGLALAGYPASAQPLPHAKAIKVAQTTPANSIGFSPAIERHLAQIKSMVRTQKYTLAIIEIKRLEAMVRQAQTNIIEAAFPNQSMGYHYRDTSSDETEYAVFARRYTERRSGTTFDVTLLVGDPFQEEIAQLARATPDQAESGDGLKTVILKNGVVAIERTGDDANGYERNILVSDSIMIRINGDASAKAQIDEFCDMIDFLKLQRGIERR